MDDQFQFIIESPQTNTTHKKRPRLVTSCDNCRLKKIKCLQPSPEAKCEACKAAKIQCRFKDRERYFAERSRAIAGPSATSGYSPSDPRQEGSAGLDAFSVASSSSSPALSNSNPRSNSHSPKASGMVSPESEPNGRYPYNPDPRRGDGYRHGVHPSSIPPNFHSRSNSGAYGYPNSNSNYVPSASPVLQHPHNQRLSTQPDYRQVQLFDPERSQFPHPSLMQHFIQLFFEHFPQYSFITYDQVMTECWENRLSPVIANAIASMASKYSTIPELTVRGVHTVAETYSDVARNLAPSLTHMPSLETIHAVMLLAWNEYQNGRFTSFRQYCQKAITMAQQMNLSDDRIGHGGEGEQRRRQSTWAGIVQLHLTSSQTVTRS